MTPEQLAKSGSEHAHQVALFAWANMAANYGVKAASDKDSYVIRYYAAGYLDKGEKPIPELALLFAIHNQGHGDKVRGSIAKAEGVKAGVPDLMLPVPRGLYYGLFIEMKIKSGKVSVEQSKWCFDLRNLGYDHSFCYSWQEARDAILKYLGK
jgi:hypothetical protein